MAKTTIWTGAVDGDVSDTNNYSNGVPVSTDTLIIDGQTTQNMDENMSALSAVDLALLFNGPDSLIDLGTLSAPFTVAADKIVHQGFGTFYYKTLPAATATTDEIIINSPNRELAMDIATHPTSDNIPVLKVVNGRTVVQEGKLLHASTVWISFQHAVNADAVLETTTSAGANIANLYMFGGIVDLDVMVSNAYVEGGTLTLGDNVFSTSNGNFYIRGGAVVNYLDDTTLDLVELVNGELNLVNRSRELTITTLRQWPQGILKTNELVTITTTEDMTGGDI